MDSKNKTTIQLNFQPLTEGLGFHPFSDGLPYAPIGRTQTSKVSSAASSAASNSASGAVAAGLPSFAAPSVARAPRPASSSGTGAKTPQFPARISVPVAVRPQYQPAQPTKSYIPAQPQAPAAQLQTQVKAAPAAAATLLPSLEPTFGMGYLVKRVFAFFVDTLFNLALCVGALSIALWRQDLSPDLLLNPGIVLVAGLFLGVFNWAITTAQEVAFSTSIGKRMFGLALNGSASAIFLRSFFFLPSLFFCGIGLVWALIDRRRRCWHDLVVDLQPIEIARL